MVMNGVICYGVLHSLHAQRHQCWHNLVRSDVPQVLVKVMLECLQEKGKREIERGDGMCESSMGQCPREERERERERGGGDVRERKWSSSMEQSARFLVLTSHWSNNWPHGPQRQRCGLPCSACSKCDTDRREREAHRGQ